MGDERENYVLYKDREEWSDLVPVEQNDGPAPVVKIAYGKEFQDAYNYFRGVVAAGELSLRALNLTEDCIEFNAANYTVWQYRRQILKHLNYNLQEELNYCHEMIVANPKNYQVWHHRRVIVEWLGNSSDELNLTDRIFKQDSKNYHAWEHRQWCLRTYNLYDGELDFIEKLLYQDIRNNSAWNHRFFVLSRTSGLTLEVVRREVTLVKRAIEKLADNESPWTYLKGLLNDASASAEELRLCWEDIEDWCWQLLRTAANVTEEDCPDKLKLISKFSKGSVSRHLLIGILDCLIERLETSTADEQTLATAEALCDSLALTHDVIRAKYWLYLKGKLKLNSD